MSEFLLEIGCEEIPANLLGQAAGSLKDLLAAELKTAHLAADDIESYYTPRRLIVRIPKMAERQEDLIETIVGPPKAVAFDKEGRPTKAATAFAGKHKASLKKLKIVTTDKGEYLGLEKKVKGEKTAGVLSSLLPGIIGSLPFPKTMYWTEDKFRFARPIRWLLAVLGGRVVKFEIAGVQSGNKTRGHRVLGKKRILVRSFDEYKAALQESFVVIDPAERREIIRKGFDGILGRLREQHGPVSIAEDEELLREVTDLNEYPQVILGDIILPTSEFLSLPNVVLMTVMRKHQKYFSLLDGEGNLYQYFLAVVNTSIESQDVYKTISNGHARVLRARLDDALFFWNADRKIKLADRVEKLRNVLFQEKLGSYYDKTQRVKAIAKHLAEVLRLDQATIRHIQTASELSKVDLITEMVKEFTELEGIMGGLYAKNEGYTENVWMAIYDQYLPRNLEEGSPRTLEGAVLSISDKIDTIVCCFAIGLVPKGSRDPFALRRQGNGIIKIILDHALNTSLKNLINIAAEQVTPKIAEALGLENTTHPTYVQESNNIKEQVFRQLPSFFEGRMRYILEARGFQYDEINATLAAGFDEPYDLLRRIEALSQIRPEEDFLAIATAFKRIKNIIRDQQVTDRDGIRPDLFEEEAERGLYGLFEEVNPKITESINRFDYYTALKHMASMRKAIDLFFDEVLVMAEDPELRANRIHLLRSIANVFLKVADLSEIVVEKPS